MQWRAAIAVVLAPSMWACGNALTIGDPDPQGSPAIVLESLGGIASLRVQLRLDSTSATLTRETCAMTVSATNCGMMGRREVVSVTAADVNRVFAMTTTAEFRALRSDYGSSTQGADLMTHKLTVTSAGRTRSVQGDDITRPGEMGRVMVALHGL